MVKLSEPQQKWVDEILKVFGDAPITRSPPPPQPHVPAKSPDPAKSPTGDKDLQGSCLIKVTNNSGVALTLLDQGHDRGDFKKFPDTTVEPGKYAAYLGEYSHQAAGKTFTVLEQDGALAVDIPGQLVVVLNEPDEEGRWFAKISPSLFFTFETDAEDRAVSLIVHEIVRLQRIRDPEEIGPEVPEPHRPYLGVYLLAQLNAEFTVIHEDETLAIVNPLEKVTVGLQAPDSRGRRLDEFGKNTIWFEEDEQGGIRAMVIDAATRFDR